MKVDGSFGLPTGRLSAVDLFAGAGGATQGLRNAGYDVRAGIENNAAACASYRLNHPEVELVQRSIEDIDPMSLRRDLALAPGELDLLTACPPCQGFSTLGTFSHDDPRNDAVLQVWEFVRTFKPRAFIVENVPALASDSRLIRVLRSARAIGYRARIYKVDATAFGVPQRRRRAIAIGVAGGGATQMPDHLGGFLRDIDPHELWAGPALAMAQTDPTDPLQVGRTIAPRTLARIQAVPVGGNRFDLPPDLQLQCHRRLGTRSASGPYGRIKFDLPAPTMTTRCTTPSCGSFIHPTEHRGLTLREAALLQTFPVNYKFTGAYGDIERQIGNAVPVRMAEGLARAVRQICATGLG